MQLLIDEIVLPNTIIEDYSGTAPFNSLKGCKKLNVIIGPNNSGKSRLLRELFKQTEKLDIAPYSESGVKLFNRVYDAMDFMEKHAGEEWARGGLKGAESIFDKQSTFFAGLSSGFSQKPDVSELTQWINFFKKLKDQSYRQHAHYANSTEAISVFGAISQAIGQVQPKKQPVKLEKLYIPTLRGLRPLEKGENVASTYFNRTWDDYFANKRQGANATEDTKKLVFTGLGLYEVIKQKLLGSVNDRKLVSDVEAFLAESFFDSRTVTLIPRHGADTLDVKIGKEAQRPITRLGDGVQQLIILTWPIFQAQNTPLFLFIEEPDLFLHPGYQRLFINTILKSKNPNLLVFATTHSHQFLDLTLESDEIAVFRCEKLPSNDQEDEHDPKFQVSNAGDANKEILKDIGVTPSSVMLANCTIWVEGITDRLYLGRYLKLYLEKHDKSYHENLHYMFVEYSGGNITHWSFLDEDGPDAERLCTDMILVADDDGATKKKKERHQQLARALGDRYIKLSTREIENTLTPEVIRSVIESYEEEGIELNQFKQKDYKRTLLGKFIDSNVLQKLDESKRYKDSASRCSDPDKATGYADSSGTVKGKVQFCKKALAHLNDFSDLSEEAQRVTKLLAEFVIEHNPR